MGTGILLPDCVKNLAVDNCDNQEIYERDEEDHNQETRQSKGRVSKRLPHHIEKPAQEEGCKNIAGKKANLGQAYIASNRHENGSDQTNGQQDKESQVSPSPSEKDLGVAVSHFFAMSLITVC